MKIKDCIFDIRSQFFSILCITCKFGFDIDYTARKQSLMCCNNCAKSVMSQLIVINVNELVMTASYYTQLAMYHVTYLSLNVLKSPSKSPTRIPFRVALLLYAGPIPFFVVPSDFPPFSASWRPSTC